VKNLKLALLTILSVSIALLSCKKTSTPAKAHVFTSSQTVTETLTTNATIAKNSAGTWVVSGITTASPVIDSLQMKGDVSFQLYDNSTYKYTSTISVVIIGQPFSYELSGANLTSPTLQQVFYEPNTETSLGSIDYTVNYQ
jgi:hypothetical protein